MTTQKFDHPSCKVLITGTSGTGKSTLLQKLTRQEPARLKFIYDHQGEFATRFGIEPVTTLDGLMEKTAKGGYVCFDPVDLFKGKSPEGLNFYCDYVLAISEKIKGRKLFICDELQKLTTTRDEPGEFLALLDVGRRFQVDVFAISQAPNAIHNRIRNQLTEVYTFRQSDANAIKYLEDNGFDGEAVRNLRGKPHHDWLWRNLGNGETRSSFKTVPADTTRATGD